MSDTPKKTKPRKPVTALCSIAGKLYQFGLSFCEERGIPISWLRLYSRLSLHADQELFSDGFYEVEGASFAEYSRRRYHFRLISSSVCKEYHVTWMTPRVWLEAPSVDDLRGYFPGWNPEPRRRNKDITLNAVAPLPRLLLGLYTTPREHTYKLSAEYYDSAVNSYRCKRCGNTGNFGFCVAYDVYPVPIPLWAQTEPLFMEPQ